MRTPPPPLTAQARAEAAQRGVLARRERAAVRKALTDREIGIAEVLRIAQSDSERGKLLARMRVPDLLCALPGIGPNRSAKIMDEVGIAASRRLGGLGGRQIEALTARLVPDPGRLIVLTGPSGVGKGTVVAQMRKMRPTVWVSVSATTRGPRSGEVPGETYLFLEPVDFERMVADDDFLEWASFAGNSYGTPRRPVEQRLAAGKSVLLEIELQGARQVRAAMPSAFQVFLTPPSWEALEARLRGRGTEDEAAISLRLAKAKQELAAAAEFDAIVVNDDVIRAASQLLDFL